MQLSLAPGNTPGRSPTRLDQAQTFLYSWNAQTMLVAAGIYIYLYIYIYTYLIYIYIIHMYNRITT